MQAQIEVEYGETKRIPTRAGKHTVTTVHVTGLEDVDQPEVPISTGQLAMGRVIHLCPEPGPGAINVRWNGDTEEPKVLLDMWFGDEATFYVQAWGG